MKLGLKIRALRKENKWLLRELAAKLNMDSAILSKIERGLRLATKSQIQELLKVFSSQKKELRVLWLTDKIVVELKNEEYQLEALQVAEQEIKYQKTHPHGRQKNNRQTKSSKSK